MIRTETDFFRVDLLLPLSSHLFRFADARSLLTASVLDLIMAAYAESLLGGVDAGGIGGGTPLVELISLPFVLMS